MAQARLPFAKPPRDPGDRDFARYRELRGRWAADVLAGEANPDDWAAFKGRLRALGATLEPAEFLGWLARSWLPAAHPDVRTIALREIAHRADAIRRQRGHDGLSDPLPGEPDSLFIRARDVLGVR